MAPFIILGIAFLLLLHSFYTFTGPWPWRQDETKKRARWFAEMLCGLFLHVGFSIVVCVDLGSFSLGVILPAASVLTAAAVGWFLGSRVKPRWFEQAS